MKKEFDIDKIEEAKKKSFDIKCKRCGYTNRILSDKRPCKNCGYFVFRDEKSEFLYRLKEMRCRI